MDTVSRVTSGSRRGGGGVGGGVSGGSKGSTQSTKLFLDSGVKFTGNALYFYQKLIFFQGGMPLDPLSYNMSDVNLHLTQCEPPPYLM